MVTRKQMMHYGYCQNNETQIPLCFQFDLLRSIHYQNEAVYDSKVHVYTTNLKRVFNKETNQWETVCYNKKKPFDVQPRRGNGEIATIKEAMKVNCLDTLVRQNKKLFVFTGSIIQFS